MKAKAARWYITTCALFVAAANIAVATPANAGTFPGKNGLIAFTTNRDGDQEIYIMAPDGANPTNLTKHPANDSEASWSPDGSKLAFQSDRDGNSEIYVMQADGSSQTRLTNNAASDTSPSWSADGNSIAFVRTLAEGNSEIFSMRSDGSQQTNLTNDPAPDSDPSWSPSGSKILFSSFRAQTGNRNIYTMNTDGTNQALYVDGDGTKVRGSWAPDGIKVVFRGQFERDELYIVGIGLYQQLTSNFNTEDVAPSGAWSPDGRAIAYQTTLNCNVEICPNPGDGSAEVYVLNPSDPSNSARNLTNNPSADTQPVWQPIPIIVPIQITTTQLPAAKAHSPYSFFLQTTGGSTPKTFSVAEGELPKDVQLDTATGQLLGTPKKPGNFTFTIKVADATGSDTQTFTLTVAKKNAPSAFN